MISNNLSDGAILRELGVRLTAARVQAQLTQAMLAEAAGVSKRTVERLESGTDGVQLVSLIRVCRALGFADGFEALVPPTTSGPMDQLKLAGRARKRVRVAAPSQKLTSSPNLAQQPRVAYGAGRANTPPWTWEEPKRAPPTATTPVEPAAISTKKHRSRA